MPSFLSKEKIVQPRADMQAGNLVEVSIVTEHGESMLQRAGRNPHVVGRNGTATASEFPIHPRILCRRLPRRSPAGAPAPTPETVKLLAILRFACADSKAAEQFAKHNTIDPNPRGVRDHLHRLGHTPFEGRIGVGIEEDVPYCHNEGSTCSKSAIACRKAAASSSLHVPANASRS